MKNSLLKISALFATLFMLNASTVHAQVRDGQPTCNGNCNAASTTDTSILDSIQKETENISAIKPLVHIAVLIEQKMEQRKEEQNDSSGTL